MLFVQASNLLDVELRSSMKVEHNTLWQQKNLTKFCKHNGILVTAYSPLGAVGNKPITHGDTTE